jgi:c-di-GMP-binding flagellar brake protein YcgR
MLDPETTSLDKVGLRLWEKLEMEFGAEDKTGLYHARIQDILPEGIVIERPMWSSGEPLFSENKPFRVTIYREDGVYQFTGSIIDSYTKNDWQYYILRTPEKINRFQRRDFVRVEINFPIHFKKLTPLIEGKTKYEQIREYTGQSINFSAAGILITAPTYLEKGDLLELKIDESVFGSEFRMPGYVRRVFEESFRGLSAGIEFIISDEMNKYVKGNTREKLPKEILNFTLGERENLVQFVFNYQIKMREKGLI